VSIARDEVPELVTELAPDPERPESDERPSRLPGGRVSVRVMTLLMIRRLWPVLTALALGCLAAVVILALALQTEFPLFSEASAARGRDCATIRSARHALDRQLELELVAVSAHPIEAGQGVQDAVAGFHAATRDLGTPSVARALGDVDRRLDALTSVVNGTGTDSAGTDTAAEVARANGEVQVSWEGAIARVCS